MRGSRIALILAALPLLIGGVTATRLAWQTRYRLTHRQAGDFCIGPRDASLAHSPGKGRGVRLMLVHAAIAGGGQARAPGWTIQYLSTDLIGLAFTTEAQRAIWYHSLPRCHPVGSVASRDLGNVANNARSSGPNAQRHSTNQ
jgi:hypothetical protein